MVQTGKRGGQGGGVVADRDRISGGKARECGRFRKARPQQRRAPTRIVRSSCRSFPILEAVVAFPRVGRERNRLPRKVCSRSRWPVQSTVCCCWRVCSVSRFLLLRSRRDSPI